MPKKDIERLFKEVGDLAARLYPDEELELEDIRGNLKAADIDTAKLRERLHDSARDLARKQRLAGKPAPKYLQEVIDATGPAEQLPRDASKAIDKMRGWIKSFRILSGVGISGMEVEHAYRKSGEVSDTDKERLDELERKLKERARQLHDDVDH